jgi:histidinol-phosphatase
LPFVGNYPTILSTLFKVESCKIHALLFQFFCSWQKFRFSKASLTRGRYYQMNTKELERLLNFGARIAREAGEITLKYFQRVSSHRKADGSLVTEADFESERFLRSEIKKNFPHDGILGEEEGEQPGTSGRRWIIDPIDGTFSFAHGVPLYGILIALEIDGESVIGVVNIPALREIVYAAKGYGCFFNGERTHTSSTERLEDALLLSTDLGMYPALEMKDASRALQRIVAECRTWGDCYGYLLVATGRADIMLDPVVKVWDCAPLVPIIEEAGGTFTDWQGQRTIYGRNALATNGPLFNQVMHLLQQPT